MYKQAIGRSSNPIMLTSSGTWYPSCWHWIRAAFARVSWLQMIAVIPSFLKEKRKWKEKTVDGEEFLQRFLMHVLPKGFVRIRHYGVLSSRNKKEKLTLCRNLIGCKKYISRLKGMDAREMIRYLYKKDICKCRACGGKMISLSACRYYTKRKGYMRC